MKFNFLIITLIVFLFVSCVGKKKIIKQEESFIQVVNTQEQLTDTTKKELQITGISEENRQTEILITEYDTEKKDNPVKKTTQIKTSRTQKDSTKTTGTEVSVLTIQTETKDTISIQTNLQEETTNTPKFKCIYFVLLIILFLIILRSCIRRHL